MFEYKTEKELSKMTSEQRDAYAVKKREHEAVKAKKEAEHIAKEVVAEAINSLDIPKRVDIDELKDNLLNDLTERMDKSIEDAMKANKSFYSQERDINQEYKMLY